MAALTLAAVTHHGPLITTNKLAPSSSSSPSLFIHNEFSFESYIKANLNLKLDNDAQLCPSFVSSGECWLGPNCPRRHVHPSPLNFLPSGSNALRDPNKRTVCKHWLRGLCKKGDQCDYLHEYDMRRIPECRFFATFGFCNSGDDCLYLHVEKAIKRRECPNYNRGFCPKGPQCEKKHVRRVACPFYLCGFCPLGKDCKLGHIKSNPPSIKSRASSPIQTHRPLTAAEAFGGARGYDDQSAEFGEARPRRQGRFGIPSSGSQHGTGPNGQMLSSSSADNSFNQGQRPPFHHNNHHQQASSQPQLSRDRETPFQRQDDSAQMQGQRRGGGGGGVGGGGSGGWRKDLSEVLCYKCSELGHFANMCPNPNRPGNRGGLDRNTGAPPFKQRFDRPRPY